MNRIFFFLILSMVLSFQTSCIGNKAKSVFGDVPMVYEQQTQPMAKEMKAASQQIGSTTAADILKSKAVDVFIEAAKIAEPAANILVGKTVEYSVDDDAKVEIKGEDVIITNVSLPQLTARQVIPQIVDVTFQVADSCRLTTVYYALTDGEDVIEVNTTGASPASSGEHNMVVSIYAPNIPADYLAKCKQLRFISADTFNQLRYDIQKKHVVWRQKYAESIK